MFLETSVFVPKRELGNDIYHDLIIKNSDQQKTLIKG